VWVRDGKLYLVCDKMGLVLDEKMYLVWAGVG
jgi:hypothetical protein